MTADKDAQLWDTRSLVQAKAGDAAPRNAMVVLNSPLPPQSLFRKLWQNGKASSWSREGRAITS